MRAFFMESTMRKALLATLVLGLGVGAMSACFDPLSDCTQTKTCPPGADGGVPVACVPSVATGAVPDSCGVFVSVSGDDGNAGTKEKPLKTITAALGKGTAVYACAGATPFSEAVTVSKAVTLFGALDCTTWGYVATSKTQLTAAADAVPLTLGGAAGGSEVHDFAITAADANKAGGSSIAVIDDGASMVLEGVSVTAGAGAAGAMGMGQAQVMTPTGANGSNGADDAACNNTTGVLGGAGGKNTCGTVATSGGIGGNGVADVSGGAGSGGNPMMTSSNGGSGETSTASCNANDPKGVDGSVGAVGIGARGVGDLSSVGYVGPAGTLGGAGTPGQGGGGGGGAHACDANNMFAGPSGGGGGAGGCAGAPGNAGQSGGSSIGILALGATLTLNAVSIAAHDGGAGGIGGDGQPGGNGGEQGNQGASGACPGGVGGQGGRGGPGGGGAGGHSIAIALKGGTAPNLGSTTIVPGMRGAGGPGGNMDMTAQTKGDDGMVCNTLDFTNPTSPVCAM